MSSIVPPTFLTILISLRSTLVAVFGSIILIIDSTAKGDNKSEYDETTFELREVLTHSIKVYLLAMSTGTDNSVLI